MLYRHLQSFKEAIFTLARFEKLFKEFNGADCALITSDINRRYFTGMRSSAGVVLAFPEKAYLIIDFRYIEKARATVTAAEVIELKRLFPQLMELIKKHGAKSMVSAAKPIISGKNGCLPWRRHSMKSSSQK